MLFSWMRRFKRKRAVNEWHMNYYSKNLDLVPKSKRQKYIDWMNRK